MLKKCVWRHQARKLFYLLSQLHPKPPISHITLLNFVLCFHKELEILISLLLSKHFNDLRQVLQRALRHISDILQQMEQDRQQVFLGQSWPQDLGDFMD